MNTVIITKFLEILYISEDSKLTEYNTVVLESNKKLSFQVEQLQSEKEALEQKMERLSEIAKQLKQDLNV